MGMRDYALVDYGMLVTDEIAKSMAAKICDNYSEDEYENDKFGILYELYEKGFVEHVFNFTGETEFVTSDGIIDWGCGEFYNCEMLCYIPAKRFPSLFKPAYSNMDELVNEFKDRLKDYLPEDFDYRGHIRFIDGIYFG